VIPAKAIVLAHARTSPMERSAARPRRGLPPTPLLPVANRPLIGHALGWLAQAGVREAAVIVPQELARPARVAAEADERLGLAMTWVDQPPGETLSHTLAGLAGFLDGEPFVLHLADSLARQSLRSLTAGAVEAELEALIVVDESAEVGLAQVVQLRATPDGGACLRALRNDAAGVAVLSASALDAAADLDAPPDRILEALAERIQHRGGRMGTRSVSEWWRFRGGSDALLEGNRFALEGQRAAYDAAHLVNSEIQGAVVAYPDVRIESSVVRGPAIIAPGARLRDAYVGPYTSIGEDVLIEGAEIEHSVVLPGATISQLGCRLEASVIGPESRVLRDFRLPRATRLIVGEGAAVSLP